jgi:hypothetical protein
LKDVSLISDDWERFKGSPEYFIADNEKLYREYDETINETEREKENHIFYSMMEYQEKKYKEGLAEFTKQ